jgi:hypothetical protein
MLYFQQGLKMENLEVISFSIYKLDVDKDQHETVNFDSNKYEKVVEYVKRVLEQILKNETKEIQSLCKC